MLRRTLGKRLVATGRLGEKVLALGDGLSAEANTLLGVEDGSLAIVSLLTAFNWTDVAYLPNKRLDAAGATVDLVESDLADDLVAMLSGMMSVLRCGGAEVGRRTFGAS